MRLAIFFAEEVTFKPFLNNQVGGSLIFWSDQEHGSCSLIKFQNYNLLNNCEHCINHSHISGPSTFSSLSERIQ